MGKKFAILFIILISLLPGCLENKNNPQKNEFVPKGLYELEIKVNNTGDYHIIVPALFSPDIDIMKYIIIPEKVSQLSLIQIKDVNITNFNYGIDIVFSDSFLLKYRIITNTTPGFLPTLSLRKSPFDLNGIYWIYFENNESINVTMKIYAGYESYFYTHDEEYIPISPGWNSIMIDYGTSDD